MQKGGGGGVPHVSVGASRGFYSGACCTVLGNFRITDIICKMPPKSNLWKYFEKTENNIAQCKACSKKIKTSGNTSNLKCHLKSMHGDIFKDAQLEKSVALISPKTLELEHDHTTSNSSTASTITVSSVDCIDSSFNSESLSTITVSTGAIKRQKTIKETFDNLTSYSEDKDMRKLQIAYFI